MRIAIHQPEFMPWPGYFNKMASADMYVLLDNVQFTKNNFQNRNRFRDRNGESFWGTVPVLKIGHTSSTISDICIDNTKLWDKKLWSRLCECYGRHDYFNEYRAIFEPFFYSKYDKIIDLNLDIILAYRDILGINVPLVKASSLSAKGQKSQLLANIVKELGGDQYISGTGGKNYIDFSLFESERISVVFQSYVPPNYLNEGHVSILSTFDMLMNMGKHASDLIIQKK